MAVAVAEAVASVEVAASVGALTTCRHCGQGRTLIVRSVESASCRKHHYNLHTVEP